MKDRPNAPKLSHFADWETLAYDNFSPHQDIISTRMRSLYELAKGERVLVVASVSTLLQRLSPKSYILGNSLVLKVGEKLPLARLREQMVQAGYNHVDTVYQHGEFAIRGGLLDIFPMGRALLIASNYSMTKSKRCALRSRNSAHDRHHRVRGVIAPLKNVP